MRKLLSQLKSIPNLLSLMRIALIPLFAAVYLGADSQADFTFSSALLILSGLTDLLDGLIARRFNMVTQLGKVLDPVADKLTQLAIIGCLVARYPVFAALLAVLLVKEGLMLVGGLLLMKRRIRPDGAKWFGKLATGFFYVSTITLVLFPGMGRGAIDVILLINMLLLAFALLMYIPVFFALRRDDAGAGKS